jgi:ABC-type glutathione transport system ATPase component
MFSLVTQPPKSGTEPFVIYPNDLTNINKLRMGKTTIFITHKPQIAELCDEIFVMENGMITSKGDRGS